MIHPIIILVSDTFWNGLVRLQFIYSKVWFVLSLAIFMLSHAILPKLQMSKLPFVGIIVFTGRTLIYLGTMCRLAALHIRHSFKEYRAGETVKFFRCVPVPDYWRDPMNFGSVCLTILLLLMLTHEPMYYCLDQDEVEFLTTRCTAADSVRFRYSVFCMFAVAIHWLLLMDMAVFSTGLSAFVLVIGQVLSEIGRVIAALVFLLLTFGSAISVLEHDYFEMRDIPHAAVALFSITLGLFEDDYRDLDEPALLAAVFLFVTASAILLLNLLIAQLNCSYVFIYQDMLGFARLNRASVIAEMLETCPEGKWNKFVGSLNLDQPVEFNEGDIGPSGAIQVMELASLHPVVADSIHRFGGSCAEDMQWPEDPGGADEEEGKYDRIERLVQKALKAISRQSQGGGGSGGGSRKHMESAGSSRGIMNSHNSSSAMSASYHEDSDAG